MGYKRLKKKRGSFKCDFVKMGTRIIPKRTSDKDKTKKILEDRKKRQKEWSEWLTGGRHG